jgi:hypothetical protein
MDGILAGYGSEEEVNQQTDDNTTTGLKEDQTRNESAAEPGSDPDDEIDNINGDVFGIKDSLSNKPKPERSDQPSNSTDKQIITTVPHVIPAIVSVSLRKSAYIDPAKADSSFGDSVMFNRTSHPQLLLSSEHRTPR